MVKRVDFSKEGKVRTKLHQIIDEQSVAANQEKKKVRTSMYASDYGSCLRKTFFNFFPSEYHPDAEIDARTARIFDNGNGVHDRLGSYLKRVPELDFRDELDVPRDELEVHGRCDGICIVDAQAMVVEFKSINKEEVYEAKDEHVGQVSWYMGMMRILRKDLREDFGILDGEVVDEEDLKEPSLSGRVLDTLTPMEKWLLLTQGEIRAELIYESKPTNEIYTFPVEFNQATFDKIHMWFEQLKWHIDNKQVPKVNYYPSKFPCSWGRPGFGGRCAYYSLCHGNNSHGDKKSDL